MFEDEENDLPDYENLEVYQKAREILDIVNSLTDSLREDIESDSENIEIIMAQHTVEYMKENAMMIPPKIAGAVGADIYDLQMENAAIIRKAARELSLNCTSLRMVKVGETDYLQLLKDEIEEFRLLFAEWVKTFDPWNYHIDRWGLFNPPGVNYDDPDPDDDIMP